MSFRTNTSETRRGASLPGPLLEHDAGKVCLDAATVSHVECTASPGRTNALKAVNTDRHNLAGCELDTSCF